MYCSHSLFGIACRPLRNQQNYSLFSCILASVIPLFVLVAARITHAYWKINRDRCACLVSSNQAQFAHYRYKTNISHSLYAGGSISASSGFGQNPAGANINNIYFTSFSYLPLSPLLICRWIRQIKRVDDYILYSHGLLINHAYSISEQNIVGFNLWPIIWTKTAQKITLRTSKYLYPQLLT